MINEEYITDLKNIKKNIIIKMIVTTIFLVVFSAVIIFFSNREYKQLFIILGFIMFSLKLTYLLYLYDTYFKVLNRQIKLFSQIILKEAKEKEATIVESLDKETFKGVIFNAYMITSNLKNYKVFCLDDLKTNTCYKLTLQDQVVVSYEE